MAGQIGQLAQMIQGGGQAAPELTKAQRLENLYGKPQQEFDPSNMGFDPTVGGLMDTGAGPMGTGAGQTPKTQPVPEAPSSIQKGIGNYKEMGGQVGGEPASKNQRMMALSQYRDVGKDSSIAGLMNMMPKQQQQQMPQRQPYNSRIDKRLQSLMM